MERMLLDGLAVFDTLISIFVSFAIFALVMASTGIDGPLLYVDSGINSVVVNKP